MTSANKKTKKEVATAVSELLPKETPKPMRDMEASKKRELAAREENLARIREEVLHGREYNAHALLDDCRLLLQNAAMVMLEVCKRVVLIKEHEGENFWPMIEQFNLDKRFVAKLLNVGNRIAVGLPAQRAERIAELGRSKMLELLALDDDELNGLSAGETVLGLNLDDVDRMSVTDLRKAVRKGRHQLEVEKETGDRMIGEKNEKIDSLVKELNKLQRLSPDEEQQARHARERFIVDDLQQFSTSVLAEVQRFSEVVQAALENPPTDATRDHVNSTVKWLFQRINGIATDAGIEVDFSEIVRPAWMKA